MTGDVWDWRQRKRKLLLNVLVEKHVFVALLTVYDKSVCYTTTPLIFDELKSNSSTGSLVIIV